MRVESGNFKNIGLLGIFSVATTIFLYCSYSFIGVGTATTLHFMYPVFVALICKAFFKEHLGEKKIVALIFAWIGVLFFMDLRYMGNFIGILMAVASSLTFALFMVFMEKKKLVKLNTYLLTLYIAVFAVAALLAGNAFYRYIIVDMSLKAYILMIIVSLCTSLMAAILIQKGIEEIGSSSAAIFSLFEPITSVITGGLFLNERISFLNIIGCIIIFGAITYLAVTNKKEKTMDSI